MRFAAVSFIVFLVFHSPLDLQLELVLGSIQTQQHLQPSIISTLPFLIPLWVTAVQSFHCNPQSIQQAPQTRVLHPAISPLQHHTVSLQTAAANRFDDNGITSVSQTLETQFSPVSTEGSPIQFEADIKFSAPPATLHFSDDDDVMPNGAWNL